MQCSTLGMILEEGSCWVQRHLGLSKFMGEQMAVYEKLGRSVLCQ